jgi:hypothetical protein
MNGIKEVKIDIRLEEELEIAKTHIPSFDEGIMI